MSVRHIPEPLIKKAREFDLKVIYQYPDEHAEEEFFLVDHGDPSVGISGHNVFIWDKYGPHKGEDFDLFFDAFPEIYTDEDIEGARRDFLALIDNMTVAAKKYFLEKKNPMKKSCQCKNPRPRIRVGGVEDKMKKLSGRLRQLVSHKISKLMSEGYSQKQAVAVALKMARTGKLGKKSRRNPILDNEIAEILKALLFLARFPDLAQYVDENIMDAIKDQGLYSDEKGVTGLGMKFIMSYETNN